MNSKKKLKIMYIGVAAVILFVLVYIFIVGKSYTLHTNAYFNDSLPKTDLTISDESVIKNTDIRIEPDGELVLDFEALQPGTADVEIRYQLDDETIPMSTRSFRVLFTGTLVETSEGFISFNGYLTVVYAFVFMLFIVQFVMLWMFSGYRKNGLFSYPMVASGGVGLYNLVLFVYLCYRLMNRGVNYFNALFDWIADTGSVFLVGLMPIMLLYAVLLAVSNIQLIRHEGRRLVNMLGIVFAVLWVAGMIVSFEFFSIADLFKVRGSYLSVVRIILTYIITYLECMLLSTTACTYLATKYTPDLDRDYIIILGCGIKKDGSLTPLLKGRVDSAVAFEKKQYEETGKHAVFVPSGGQGSDEIISEGEAMERYLLSIGIPQEQIMREDKSTNTFENMKFSKEVIEKHGGEIKDKNIAFATTNYHVFRGYILAEKNGFTAKGISAKTKPYFYLNAFLREFIGLLVDQKRNNAIFILITIIAISLIYFLA